MKSYIDELKESTFLLPFFGGYFIIYGSVNLIAYYEQFNINIIQYIEFSEIISYFIKDIFLILFHLVVLFVGIVVYDLTKGLKPLLPGSKLLADVISIRDERSKIGELLDELEKGQPSEGRMAKLKELKELHEANKVKSEEANQNFDVLKRRIKYLKRFGSLLLIGLTVLMWYLAGYSNTLKLLIPIILTILLTYSTASFRVYFVTYTVITLLTSSFFSALQSADKVKNGGYYGVEFGIDNKFIKSDSLNYFVGKTGQYIFYYNSSEKKTTVYPADKLDFIKIPIK